jgi:hypothetical protein
MTKSTMFCLDAYVIDTLMHDLVGHDRRPSAFIAYLFLLRECSTDSANTCRASLARIAEATGLSRRTIQQAIVLLRRRKLLVVSSETRTAIPEYVVRRPWADARGRA